jgi:hypothetical protein
VGDDAQASHGRDFVEPTVIASGGRRHLELALGTMKETEIRHGLDP